MIGGKENDALFDRAALRQRIAELEAENKRLSENAGKLLAEADFEKNKISNRCAELRCQLAEAQKDVGAK